MQETPGDLRPLHVGRARWGTEPERLILAAGKRTRILPPPERRDNEKNGRVQVMTNRREIMLIPQRPQRARDAQGHPLESSLKAALFVLPRPQRAGDAQGHPLESSLKAALLSHHDRRARVIESAVENEPQPLKKQFPVAPRRSVGADTHRSQLRRKIAIVGMESRPHLCLCSRRQMQNLCGRHPSAPCS